MQFTLLGGKHQPKYKCPCEKLWGNKLKLNWHFMATPCPSVKAVKDCKPWPIVVKALQITNMLGVTSNQTFIPSLNPREMHNICFQTGIKVCPC
jgi:hypothetical protein